MKVERTLCYQRVQDVTFDIDTENYIRKICARVVDLQEDAIVEACIKAAKEAGINDLYLLDKNFVISALMDKLGRAMEARWNKDNWETFPGGYVCSQCHTGFEFPYAYCPNCGAKMKVEEDTNGHQEG